MSFREMIMEDGPCYYCGEKTDGLAASPSVWPLVFCQADEPGVPRFHHVGCITKRVVIGPKKVVFLDMDGVMADFDGALPIEQQKPVGTSAWDPPAMFEPGFFRNLKVMPGAKEAVAKLLAAEHLDVYIGSKPTAKNTLSATEKYDWIQEHFPALIKKVFLVSDKALLRGDVLVDDDRSRWEPVFPGRFIYFDRGNPEWSWAHVVGELCGYEPCPECGAKHNRFHHSRLADA